MNIELRYCGDGIYDPGNGEVCDPNDVNHTGWGNGGCNQTTCQPLITTVPSCDNLTMNPMTGASPLNSQATCQFSEASSVKIDCGNGQVFTAPSNGGSAIFQKICNYSAPGSYLAKCFANDTITSNACQKTVTVNPPQPSITIDKRDANPADKDGNIGNDTQTVALADTAIFKITVTNNGPEALNNLVITDTVEPSC